MSSRAEPSPVGLKRRPAAPEESFDARSPGADAAAGGHAYESAGEGEAGRAGSAERRTKAGGEFGWRPRPPQRYGLSTRGARSLDLSCSCFAVARTMIFESRAAMDA